MNNKLDVKRKYLIKKLCKHKRKLFWKNLNLQKEILWAKSEKILFLRLNENIIKSNYCYAWSISNSFSRFAFFPYSNDSEKLHLITSNERIKTTTRRENPLSRKIPPRNGKIVLFPRSCNHSAKIVDFSIVTVSRLYDGDVFIFA